MNKIWPLTFIFVFVSIVLAACSIPKGVTTSRAPASPTQPASFSTATQKPPTPTPLPLDVSISLGEQNVSQGLTLQSGGDVDTVAVQTGNPPESARQTGNGSALTGDNSIADSYMQFDVNDSLMYAVTAEGHVRVEVDYLDQGNDTFNIEYDAAPTSGSDGKFYGGGSVVKTNSGVFKTAILNLCDAYFGNRDNGGDFRISDNGDGAETIKAVRVIGLPSGLSTINVDDFGANPMDDQPDSQAIQAALDSTCSGDTVVFSSGGNTTGYQGYLINQTLFLTGTSAKHNLTFSSSDPGNHAILKATADLKGFVVRLYARSRVNNPGGIDMIDFGFIDVDGDRPERVCSGPDQVSDGVNDNWGSWLPECSQAGDPWCSPGNIAMDGALVNTDATQNYQEDPSNWSTGLVLHDLVDRQGECASALSFAGAAGTIQNVTIDTAGDHVHAAGCALTDNDGDAGGWSDGITLFGPAQHVLDNTIIDPSDVGIVLFGGSNTVISGNTIRITPGNYGAFAAIAVHTWDFGDVSGDELSGNTILSEGNGQCGGLHVGINLGPHMWGGGCVQNATGAAFGNPTCSINPDPATVAPCVGGTCQIWSMLPAGRTFTMKDNSVTGAQINYLMEGFDILGQFIDQNNTSQSPQVSDWAASRQGCDGVTWGAFDKVAHHPSMPGWTDLEIHCER